MDYLFISHAEKDSDIVKEFVELLYSIGLKEENIFCSSISEIGVPIKEDIYEYLHTLLDSNKVIPVFMLSDNYYNSTICLNEMGAIWHKQKDYYTFLLPGFSFSQIKGTINANKRGIKLDNPNISGDLTNFKNCLVKHFKLQRISEQRWERYRDEFIDFINNIGQNDEIQLNLEVNQTYCIGDENYGACQATIDQYKNQAKFVFDFNKTQAQLCSFVVFTGGLDLRQAMKNKKQLEFSIKASDSVKTVSVEMHLKSMNPSQTIEVDSEWDDISIPLSKFVGLESFWEACNEVCFVVNRVFTEQGEIKIKDLKIT